MPNIHETNVTRGLNALRCIIALCNGIHSAAWIEALRAAADEIERGNRL